MSIFNPVDLERQLTQYFADATSMVIDTDIFRGPLPSEKINAVGVFLGGDTRGNDPSMWRYDAQILGRYLNRDDAVNTAQALWQLLPSYGAQMTILRVGSAAHYLTRWNGRDAWGISLNLSVSWR